MSLQTAAGARAAFLAKINSLPGLDGVQPDDLDPADLPAGGLFVTIQEGADRLLNVIMGGNRPQYEVYSTLSLDIVSRYADKAQEAQARQLITEAIEQDPTLGGAVDDVVITDAANETDPETGATRARASALNIELHYLAANPVG